MQQQHCNSIGYNSLWSLCPLWRESNRCNAMRKHAQVHPHMFAFQLKCQMIFLPILQMWLFHPKMVRKNHWLVLSSLLLLVVIWFVVFLGITGNTHIWWNWDRCVKSFVTSPTSDIDHIWADTLTVNTWSWVRYKVDSTDMFTYWRNNKSKGNVFDCKRFYKLTSAPLPILYKTEKVGRGDRFFVLLVARSSYTKSQIFVYTDLHHLQFQLFLTKNGLSHRSIPQAHTIYEQWARSDIIYIS